MVLLRPPNPLKVKELHVENIWVTVQVRPCLYSLIFYLAVAFQGDNICSG